MEDKKKIKFIRKNGKVIPIKDGKKKSSDNITKKKAVKRKTTPKFQRDVQRAKKFEFAGAAVGLLSGGYYGLKTSGLIGAGVGSAIGTYIGSKAGRETGISVGSVVKKRKGDSQKRLAQRAVKRAERIRKALNSTGF